MRAIMYPARGNSSVELSETKSDQQGRYSLRGAHAARRPLGDDRLQIRSRRGTFAGAARRSEALELRSRGGILLIHPFDGDRTGLDLVMDSRPQGPGNEVLRNDESSAISPDLLNLERAIKLARRICESQPGAQTQDEKDAAYDLFPSESLIKSCLAVEAKHRGTRTAIGAMHWIMRMAAMNSHNPATAARERLTIVLRDHYTATRGRRHAD